MERQVWVLARKEVLTLFRDPGALIIALLTPFLLTLIVGAAFANDTGPTHIPVLLLDRDGGVYAESLRATFFDPALADLVTPQEVADEAAARAQVEADEVAALVIIPRGYSEALFPQHQRVLQTLGIDLLQEDAQDRIAALEVPQKMQLLTLLKTQPPPSPVEVLIYASPERPVSTFIIKSIAQRAIEEANLRTQGTRVMIEHLYQTIPPDVWEAHKAAVTFDMEQLRGTGELPVHLQSLMPSGRPFRWLDYIASSMAVLFLMFTVTAAGRTLLTERERGTLPRLLLTPTRPATILAGKLIGNVLTGFAQMLLLWGATSLFGAWWGPAPFVLISIAVLVVCATGVGALLAAWARTPTQAGMAGTAISLIGAALAGSFLPRENLPAILRTLSLITPHAWGIELFTALHLGADMQTLWPLFGGSLLLGLMYYGLALVGFRRQFNV